MILSGKTQMGMQDEVIYAPALTIEVVQGYSVDPPSQPSPLKPGGKAELNGKVRREPGFTGQVTYAIDALPLDVTCQAAETPEAGLDYKLTCEAGANAEPGTHRFFINPASILAGGESEGSLICR